MSDETAVTQIPADDPRNVERVLAVHGGDLHAIRRLLAENPTLARGRLPA